MKYFDLAILKYFELIGALDLTRARPAGLTWERTRS
jgi:hypothetical protein